MSQPESPDTVKKWMTCLGCGKKMWTDRCHRLCKKCREGLEVKPPPPFHHVWLPSEEGKLREED